MKLTVPNRYCDAHVGYRQAWFEEMIFLHDFRSPLKVTKITSIQPSHVSVPVDYWHMIGGVLYSTSIYKQYKQWLMKEVLSEKRVCQPVPIRGDK